MRALWIQAKHERVDVVCGLKSEEARVEMEVEDCGLTSEEAACGEWYSVIGL